MSIDTLRTEHTPGAIQERLKSGPAHSYLRDFVYGGVDGVITTFAVVSGVAGAGLSSRIIVILGAANLAADGLSMAVGNFLGTRADCERLARARKVEEEHIRLYPEGEREEVRQIYAAKGFSGEELERAITVVTSNQKSWVDTMIREEYGLAVEPRSPWRAAIVTFGAFVLLGALPLVAFLGASSPYLTSTILTGISLFLIGAIKARFVSRSWFSGGIETLLVGGAAASVAYGVGALLGRMQ
jgi:VIT1/CCC1 family predicted Fe2+/Mn2+ transporter